MNNDNTVAVASFDAEVTRYQRMLATLRQLTDAANGQLRAYNELVAAARAQTAASNRLIDAYNARLAASRPDR